MGSLTDHNTMSHQTHQYNEARESIIQTANMVFSSFSDLPKMVQNAKLLGEAAAILIRLINTKAGEAKDEDVRREMVAQAKKLAAVTQDMVSAIKTTVANPDDESQREMFRTAVDELISASNLATSNVIECTMKLAGTMKTYGADVRQIKYELPAIQVGQVKYKTSEAQAAGTGNVKYQLSGMQSNVQQANIAQLPTVQVAQVHYQGAESQSSGGQVKYQLPAMQSGVQQSNIGQQVQFAQVQYQGTNAQQGGGQVKYQLQGVQSGAAQGNVVHGLPTVQLAQVQYSGAGQQPGSGQVTYQLAGATQGNISQTNVGQRNVSQVAQVQYSGAGQQPGSGQVTYQLAGATQGNISQTNVGQRNVSQLKYQLPADQMRSDVRYVTMDGGQFAAMDSKHSTLDSRNATLGSNLSGQILILDSRYNTLDSSQYVSANSRGSTLDSTVTSSTMESFNESSVSTRADYSTRTDYSVKTNYVDESQVKYNYGVKKGLKGTALVNMNALSQDRKRKHDGDLEQEVRFVEEKKTIYEWGIDRGMSGKAIVNLDALSKRKKRMVRRKKIVEGYEEFEEYSDEYSDGDLEIDDDIDEKRRLARLRMEEPFIKRTTIIVEDNGEELDMEDVSPNFEAFFRNMKRGEPREDVMKELEDVVDLSDIIQIDNLTPDNLHEGLTKAEERKVDAENIPPDFSAFFATYISTYGWPSDPEVLGPGAKPIEELIDAQNLLKPDDPDRDGAESVLSEAEGGACGPDLLGGGGGPTKMFVLPDYDSYFRQAKAKPRGKFVQCDLGDDMSDGSRKIAVGFMIPYRRIVLACAPADQPRKKAQAQLVRVLKTFQSVAVKTIRAVLSTRTRVVYKRTYRRRRGGGGGESEKKSQAELQQDELMKKFKEAKLKVKGREAESYGQAEGKLLESKESLASDAAEAKAAFLRFASLGIKGQGSGDGDDDASWSKSEVVVSKQSCAELAGLLMQFQQAYQDVLDASMILGKHTTVEWHQKCVVKTTKFFSFSATTVVKGARLFTSSSNISETKSNLALAAQDLTTSIDEMMGVCHERFPDENAGDAGNSVEPDKLLELLKAVTSHAPNSDVAEIKEFKELAAIMAESRGDTRMGKAVQARMELLATYLQNNPDYSGFDFAEYKKRILGF